MIIKLIEKLILMNVACLVLNLLLLINLFIYYIYIYIWKKNHLKKIDSK